MNGRPKGMCLVTINPENAHELPLDGVTQGTFPVKNGIFEFDGSKGLRNDFKTRHEMFVAMKP